MITYDVSGQPLGSASKVWSGLGGGTVGAAVAQIIAWILQQYTNVEMPVAIQMAIASVLSTGFAILAAHNTPPNVIPPPDPPAPVPEPPKAP
jgi:hypothetical protein